MSLFGCDEEAKTKNLFDYFGSRDSSKFTYGNCRCILVVHISENHGILAARTVKNPWQIQSVLAARTVESLWEIQIVSSARSSKSQKAVPHYS